MENDLSLKIKRLTADLTGIETELLTASADFAADLNLNQTEVHELIAGLEKKLNFEIETEEISKIKTFGKLVTLVTEKLEE